MPTTPSMQDVMNQAVQLEAGAAAFRAHAAAMYGQQPGNNSLANPAPLGANDLSLSNPTPPPPNGEYLEQGPGPMPVATRDEAVVNRMTAMANNSPVPQPPQAPAPQQAGMYGPPAMAQPDIPAAAAPGAPPAAPASDTPMPRIGSIPEDTGTQSPLEQTRDRLQDHFSNHPQTGIQWLQQHIGLDFDEARKFLSGAGPLDDDTIQKFDQRSQEMGRNGEQLNLPSLSLGTMTPSAVKEQELARAFEAGGTATDPLEQPTDETQQSVQDVGPTVTDALIKAGAKGQSAAASHFQDPLMQSLVDQMKSYNGISGLTEDGKAQLDALQSQMEVRRTVLGLQQSGASPQTIREVAYRLFPIHAPQYAGWSSAQFKPLIDSYLSAPRGSGNGK